MGSNTSYGSKMEFPGALLTVIVESAMSDYRSASADYMKDTRNDESLNPTMLTKYKELCGMVESCLVPSNYEKKTAVPSDYSAYIMSTEFRKLAPKSNSAVFSNLQTSAGVSVQVRISQGKNEQGQSVNNLGIGLSRQ